MIGQSQGTHRWRSSAKGSRANPTKERLTEPSMVPTEPPGRGLGNLTHHEGLSALTHTGGPAGRPKRAGPSPWLLAAGQGLVRASEGYVSRAELGDSALTSYRGMGRTRGVWGGPHCSSCCSITMEIVLLPAPSGGVGCRCGLPLTPMDRMLCISMYASG